MFRGAPSQPAKMPVRNPILQEEVPEEVFKPSRMRVETYKSSGTEVVDKPRCMAKGTFSLKNMGTFSLAPEDPDTRPPRKVVEPRESQEALPSRKAPGLAPPPRNPITQEDVPLESVPTRPSTTLSWRPSEASEALNNKRYFMPSESHPGKQRYAPGSNTQKSDIFGLNEQPEAEAKQRLTLERPPQAGSLLQYKFAPDFRNDGVSAKPEAQLLAPKDYQDFHVHRNKVELYKIRRNQSTLTF